MAKHWIQKAARSMKERGTEGSFSRAAAKRGESTEEFADKVHSNPDEYSPKMRKKANFARNVAK